MAFSLHGSLNPHGAPVLQRVIITDSLETTVFQSLQVTSNFLAAGTTGSLVFGHISAHSTKLGVGLNTTGAAGAAMGTYANTYTVASTNESTEKVKGECDVSKFSQYTVTPDDTVGSNDSEKLGYHIDLTDADSTDEDTAATTTAQYTIWGLDPNDSTKHIVSIYESQVFGV